MQAEQPDHMIDITTHHLKTADPVKILAAVRARLAAYDALHAISNNRKTKKLQFAMRGRTQRTDEEVIRRISFNKTTPLAIGNGCKNNGFKGEQCTPGGPLKRLEKLMLKKNLDVFKVNEAFTSQASSCCPGAIVKSQPNGVPEAKYKVKTKPHLGPTFRRARVVPNHIHGLSICTKCNICVSRDKSASKNIWLIATALLNDEERPSQFCSGEDNRKDFTPERKP